MAEPKKKPVASGATLKASPPGSQTTPAQKTAPVSSEPLLSREEMDALSPLQLVDMITGKLPPHHLTILDMIYLRDRVAEMEEVNDQAR